ncbi:MAG: hypothetical protein OXI96_07005 [Acidimicrobiaceae bacterium]|nr:hypothetical protein [Acidimicrobiaceae bacterium]
MLFLSLPHDAHPTLDPLDCRLLGEEDFADTTKTLNPSTNSCLVELRGRARAHTLQIHLALGGFRLTDVGTVRIDELWLRDGLSESFLAASDRASGP